MAFFREIRKRRAARTRKVAAFGSTRRAGHARRRRTPVVAGLLEAGTAVATIFGKTWRLHVRDVLRTTGEENLAMIADTVALPQGARAGGDLRRRALLRRLQGRRRTTRWPRCRPRRRRARTRWCCATPTAARLPHEVYDDHARGRGGAFERAGRHPRPQRRRTGRGQHAGGRARRRRPGAGHDQRLRRALRQRQPVLDHPEPGAEDGRAVPVRGARWRSCASCPLFVDELANLRPDRKAPYVGAQRLRPQGGHARRRRAARTRAASSTSTRSGGQRAARS